MTPSADGSRLRLDGQVFAITGSSRGIGAAVAEDLASRGADVVLNGRDNAALERQVTELTGGSRVSRDPPICPRWRVNSSSGPARATRWWRD